MGQLNFSRVCRNSANKYTVWYQSSCQKNTEIIKIRSFYIKYLTSPRAVYTYNRIVQRWPTTINYFCLLAQWTFTRKLTLSLLITSSSTINENMHVVIVRTNLQKHRHKTNCGKFKYWLKFCFFTYIIWVRINLEEYYF